MKDFCIYALTDPRDDRVFYVGQTDSAERREGEHQFNHSMGNKEKYLLVLEIKNAGLKLIFTVVEDGLDFMEINKREKWWVNHFTMQGHKLLNGNRGNVSKNDLFRPAEAEAYDERLRLIRNELQEIAVELLLALTNQSKEGAALLKAVDAIDLARFRLENRMIEKRTR